MRCIVNSYTQKSSNILVIIVIVSCLPVLLELLTVVLLYKVIKDSFQFTSNVIIRTKVCERYVVIENQEGEI